MATHHGIAADLGPEDIDADVLARSSYLLVEGYLLPDDRTREAVMEAFTVAQNKGVQVALAVSAPFIAASCRDLLWELVEGPVDLLFLNRREARALTGREDPADCAREIHRHSADVVLTLGAAGSLLLFRNQIWTVQAAPVTAVDTTGAGDMYAAGFLFGRTHGLSWPEAGCLGSRVASRVISGLGSRLRASLQNHEVAELTSDLTHFSPGA
jgi:sugar/nucleoside kinase (ribokinase family)